MRVQRERGSWGRSAANRTASSLLGSGCEREAKRRGNHHPERKAYRDGGGSGNAITALSAAGESAGRGAFPSHLHPALSEGGYAWNETETFSQSASNHLPSNISAGGRGGGQVCRPPPALRSPFGHQNPSSGSGFACCLSAPKGQRTPTLC